MGVSWWTVYLSPGFMSKWKGEKSQVPPISVLQLCVTLGWWRNGELKTMEVVCSVVPLSLKWHLVLSVQNRAEFFTVTFEIVAEETKNWAWFLGWLQWRVCTQNAVLDFLTSRSWPIGSLRFFVFNVLPAKKTDNALHILWQSMLIVGMGCGLYIVGYNYLPEYNASSFRHPREIIST